MPPDPIIMTLGLDLEATSIKYIKMAQSSDSSHPTRLHLLGPECRGTRGFRRIPGKSSAKHAWPKTPAESVLAGGFFPDQKQDKRADKLVVSGAAGFGSRRTLAISDPEPVGRDNFVAAPKFALGTTQSGSRRSSQSNGMRKCSDH